MNKSAAHGEVAFGGIVVVLEIMSVMDALSLEVPFPCHKLDASLGAVARQHRVTEVSKDAVVAGEMCIRDRRKGQCAKKKGPLPPPGIRPLSVIVFLSVPFLRNGNPVSYTHLDVYKRQAVGRVRGARFGVRYSPVWSAFMLSEPDRKSVV